MRVLRVTVKPAALDAKRHGCFVQISDAHRINDEVSRCVTQHPHVAASAGDEPRDSLIASCAGTPTLSKNLDVDLESRSHSLAP